jgi:hypothetical protein
MPVIFEQAPSKILEAARKEIGRRGFFEVEAADIVTLDPLQLYRIKPTTETLDDPDEMKASWAVLFKSGIENAIVEVEDTPYPSSQGEGKSWFPTHIYNFVNDAIETRRAKIRNSSISIMKFREIQLTAIRVEDHDGASAHFNALFRLVHKRSDFRTYDFKDFWAKVAEHRGIWREDFIKANGQTTFDQRYKV